MTSTSRSHLKSFSSFLLTATILTASLLAFVPVAFGQAGDPSGATAKAKLKSHFKPIFEKFGQNSTTKIKVVSGPEAVQMRNGRVVGKQWIATSGEYRFKLTIEEATGAKHEQLVGHLEKLPSSYLSACVAVSDKGEDGIAIYADLGGARAHGGKGYINLVPHADALVIAHEAGHTQKPVAPATTKSKGKRVFFTGHSFFIAGGYMAKKLDLIAKAAGKEKHELVGWRYSGGRSGAVDKWWEKGADQEPRKSVAAGKVDVLTLCTYWMKKGSEQERCVQNFVKLMQESNPDGLVYLITTKIPFDGQYQDKGGWNARTKAELAKLSGWVDETHRYANHHGALVDEINKAYGKTVIKAVPLYYGQALLRMQIIDGQVPGVKKQSELYRDAMGHVSELGQRLNAFTVFAAIYGGTPVGLQVPEWEKSGDAVRRAQNMSLQNAAWAAVQAAPVTREGRNRSIKE